MSTRQRRASSRITRVGVVGLGLVCLLVVGSIAAAAVPLETTVRAQVGATVVDFGELAVDGTSTAELRISALETNTVAIETTCAFTGSHPGQFTIVEAPPDSLLPGESETFLVAFEPTSVGEKRALLTCGDGATAVTWSLVGVGVAPAAPFDDTTIVAVGTGTAILAAAAVAFERGGRTDLDVGDEVAGQEATSDSASQEAVEPTTPDGDLVHCEEL